MKIILADDEPLMLELLESLVTSLKHEVLGTANDGDEAIALLECFPQADLLISDINMPNLDGWSLVAKIREASWKIPVILVTGLQHHLYDQRCSTPGIVCVINKVDDFIAKLEAAISECEARLHSEPVPSC